MINEVGTKTAEKESLRPGPKSRPVSSRRPFPGERRSGKTSRKNTQRARPLGRPAAPDARRRRRAPLASPARPARPSRTPARRRPLSGHQHPSSPDLAHNNTLADGATANFLRGPSDIVRPGRRLALSYNKHANYEATRKKGIARTSRALPDENYLVPDCPTTNDICKCARVAR